VDGHVGTLPPFCQSNPYVREFKTMGLRTRSKFESASALENLGTSLDLAAGLPKRFRLYRARPTCNRAGVRNL